MAEPVGGLDLSDLDSVTESERKEFRDYYQRRLAHIQRGLTFLPDNPPDSLKRFRLMVTTGHDPAHVRPLSVGVLLDYMSKALPNQVIPTTLIQFNATRGNLSGMRENVLLARGLGLTKREALQAVMGRHRVRRHRCHIGRRRGRQRRVRLVDVARPDHRGGFRADA